MIPRTRQKGRPVTIDERVRAEQYECAIPTQVLGHCKRPATEHFVKRDGTCVTHVCTQHAKGAGAARLLLPFPWEYDHTETYRKVAPR